jgi:peptide/nickel transport system permease protein
MVVANIGVSMPIFWLGLLLAAFFGVALKDTPFQLPTGSRLTAGLTVPSLFKVWGLENVEGFPAGVLTFLSNMYLFNSFVTGNWKVFGDALRHLILPAIARTIPMAIIAHYALQLARRADLIHPHRAASVKERSVVPAGSVMPCRRW